MTHHRHGEASPQGCRSNPESVPLTLDRFAWLAMTNEHRHSTSMKLKP
jgi:hypothetical protein